MWHISAPYMQYKLCRHERKLCQYEDNYVYKQDDYVYMLHVVTNL